MDENVEAALMEAGARINALVANERRLVDELAKALKDAERYRWLRDKGSDTCRPFVNRWHMDAALCDAAIDNEMAKQRQLGAA